MNGFFNPFVGGANGSGGGGGGDDYVKTINLLQEPYLSTVQNGSLSDDTGQPTARPDRATCYSYIDIPDNSARFKVDIKISDKAGKYFVDLYDENENYLYSATKSTDPLTNASYYSFTDSGTLRTVHPSAKKIRVGVRNASNTNFLASSITEFKATFVGNTYTATDVSYSGASSGLTATNVQDAIDEVQRNIENIPNPMSYQGTLGVGGEVTELPAPSEANRGYTYKVVTAGTYQGIAAKVGDTFISYATRWDLVPSGDEPSVIVDDELSTTSVNPVQNKVVTEALDGKVNTEEGKGLSTNDYTTAEKTKLAGLSNYDDTEVRGLIATKADASIFDPISESAYEALATKDKPLYFIYD